MDTDRVGSIPEYLSATDIKNIAEARVAAEMRDKAVEREVVRVRARMQKPWWKRILPTITITWNKP
jgi:hypothetical protein